MGDKFRFGLNRIKERLWVKPLLICALSITGAFLAKMADHTGIERLLPDITPDSIQTLLKIISASMLVIATFAVASMVSACASASSTAIPRSFSLVIADDVSLNALSSYIGAFIFSIVALIASENGYYDKAGRFALFALTVMVFAIVIVTFVGWVDRIARLGRLGAIIDKALRGTVETPDHPIGRDGAAGTIEVVARLQKALASLAWIGDAPMREIARGHARMALARAEHALTLPEDREAARTLAAFAHHA